MDFGGCTHTHSRPTKITLTWRGILNIIRPWTRRFNDHQDLLCMCAHSKQLQRRFKSCLTYVQAIRHSFTYLVIFSLRHYRGGWQRRVRVCGSMWRNQSPGWWWRRMQGMRRTSCTYWGVCKLQYSMYGVSNRAAIFIWSFKGVVFEIKMFVGMGFSFGQVLKVHKNSERKKVD